MLIYDLAAVGAAACWAMGGLIGATPARHFGAFAFSRIRLTLLTLLLGAASFAIGGWASITAANLGPIALSALAGIFLGDALMFAAMNRLGPRRTGLLFASHSVFSVGLGVMLLGEQLTLMAALGSVLVFGGVLVAIAFGRRDGNNHAWEKTDGLKIGIALGLAAGLCQAIGTFAAKPAMAAGLEPVTASALRMGIGCAANWLLWASGSRLAHMSNPATPRMLALLALNGIVALGLGMTLIMVALQGGNVATVGMLSALSPILILPMLWAVTRQMPPLLGWLGAAISVAGTMLIVAQH